MKNAPHKQDQRANHTAKHTYIQLPLRFYTPINQIPHLFLRQWLLQYLLPRLHIPRPPARQERAGRLNWLHPFFPGGGNRKESNSFSFFLLGGSGAHPVHGLDMVVGPKGA